MKQLVNYPKEGHRGGGHITRLHKGALGWKRRVGIRVHGKFNRTKAAAFLYLRKQHRALTALEVHRGTSLCYAYLRVRLSYWARLGYVIRSTNSRGTFTFRISSRGRDWCNRVQFIGEKESASPNLSLKIDNSRPAIMAQLQRSGIMAQSYGRVLS